MRKSLQLTQSESALSEMEKGQKGFALKSRQHIPGAISIAIHYH